MKRSRSPPSAASSHQALSEGSGLGASGSRAARGAILHVGATPGSPPPGRAQTWAARDKACGCADSHTAPPIRRLSLEPSPHVRADKA